MFTQEKLGEYGHVKVLS